MQYLFGSGVLWGTQLQDAFGNTLAVPQPVQFGIVQDVSVDISFDTKLLTGQYQFPVAVGRGKGKIAVKAKFAKVNGATFSDLFFGQTLNVNQIGDNLDTTGSVIPGTPYQVTPTVPNSGTWSADLGVRDSNGIQLTKVASGPATKQYSVAAGVYTFAAADTGLTVFIDFQYTFTNALGHKQTVTNLVMGSLPIFQLDLYVPYSGKQMILSLLQCVSSKLSIATKLDDFAIPEIDIDCFANGAGQVLTWSLSE
jgi:hypothetical protein